jgi:hypothetical protein
MALTVKTSQLPNSGKGLFTTTAIKKGLVLLNTLEKLLTGKNTKNELKEMKMDIYFS